MNILFVSNIYPTPVEPGKGVFNRQLLRALAEHHSVRALVPIPWTVEPTWNKPPELRGDRSRLLDDVRIEHPRFYYPPKVMRSRNAWFYWRSVRRTVRRVCQSFTPDLVLSYWAHADGTVGNRIARQVGARSAIIVGGSDVLIDTRHPTQRERIVSTLRSADAVLAVSDDLRRKVLELGVSSEHVHLWRQGVETSVFQPGDQAAARARLGTPNDAPLLVWVGRMVAVKGLDILIHACRLMRAQGQPFRLILVGDGPLRASLESDCRNAQFADSVTFAGACEQEGLADWYRAADLVVLPSRSEGLPNVLREAVSCGVPFVASRVGGISEIAEDGLDRLVPPENPAALAAAVIASLAERGRRPQRSYRPLNWSESAEHLVELLAPQPVLSAVS